MLQEHYRFIFDALFTSGLTGDSTYDVAKLRQRLTALKAKKKGAQTTDLEKQFEVKIVNK